MGSRFYCFSMRTATYRAYMNDMRRRNIGAHAAAAAFFLFLSLVPMLVMLCSLLPYTAVTREILMAAAAKLIPDALNPLVQQIIGEVYGESPGILSAAALVTLWSAGKGVMALKNGLNAIAGVEERRNYFVVRLVCSFYTLMILVGLLAALFFMAFGRGVTERMVRKIPWLADFGFLRACMQVAFVWLLLSLSFGAVYTYIPSARKKFQNQVQGAIFAAVTWSAFSWGFSLYLRRMGDYNIYGSLSLVILMMLWLYFGMYIVLMGAWLNQVRDTPGD